MKKIVIALLFAACSIAHAQTGQQKVWDLLLQNKRDDARKLFDKDLKKKMGSDIELLLLDAIIDVERGRSDFNTDFLSKFSKLRESSSLLYPIWYYPFAAGNVNSNGYDDLSYTKMDFISGNDAYRKDLMVQYSKAVYDRKRRRYDAFTADIAQLGAIEKWQYCGVFENMNGSGLQTDYEPEYYANNDKSFNANSNGTVNWYNPAIQQREGYHFYYNENDYGNGIMYAQTFINSPADKDVVLYFGTGGPLKIFVNDNEVYVNDKAQSTDLNAYQLKFTLKKGMNRLVIKSSVNGGNDYFFAALKNADQNPVDALEYFDTYKPYNKSTLAELNPAEIAPAFETYLEAKVKASPANPLYRILLFDAYTNNHKDEKAYEAIEPLTVKYPGSSMLKNKLMLYYNHIDEDAKVDELNKNMLATDEEYHISIINKFNDGNFLKEANIAELEKYRDKSKKLYSQQYFILYDYIIALRNRDIDLSLKKLDELIKVSNNNEIYIKSFAGVYASLKNDKEKTIAMLESLVKDRENMEAQNSLISYYNTMGRKDDVKRLVNDRIARYPYFNSMYNDAITLANNDNNYEESLKLTDVGLKNFPYSFSLLEEKGKDYNSLKKTVEAEKYFKESLVYHSGNNKLRKTLYDITKVPDEIDQLATKDIYTVIKQRRNSKLLTNYGINLLLDEYIVNVFPEGGRKSKITYLYEIVAESGIEELKEYNINGDGLNILKAEIVRVDGSIVPGEQNYDTVVFTGLKVGDVVHIEYETNDNGYGRFFKDFTISYYFNGAYPSQQSIFGIAYPNDIKFNQNIINGGIPFKIKKLTNRTYISWEKKDIPGLPLFEDYAPEFDDLANKITVSTIKSWADISNWYADLVKKNMKLENVALKTYNEIFPQGTAGMKQEDIAYKIYSYIESNISYSSLDFRQSGYVPQKPAKTISSKLGDCKDVSTLFVAMAEKAGLKANLVLVQTNDNGINSLKLPSINFNHCIVKVMIDGKEQFLEMTNKYLPFKAMPSTLYNANALIISFDKAENEKSGLIHIPFANALTNTINTVSTITVEDEIKKFDNFHTLSGSSKSYYNELFSDATTAEFRKKDFEENINTRLNKVISLEEVKLISNDRFAPEIKYQTKFSISEKLQSVGSLKIMEVPFLDKVYTRDIITNEKRNFDINYSAYERVNNYKSEVTVNIAAGRKFIEMPQNHDYIYKNHHYTINYEQVSPNSLKVTRTVVTPWNNITVAEYPEFKKYIENVIAAEEEIVGFK